MDSKQLLLAILAYLSFLLPLNSPALAQKTTKMTVGFSATGGQYINLFAAKELGLFDKRSLDVTLNQINSSAQTVASLRSASVDIATGPAAPVIDAIAKALFGIALVSLVTYVENRFCNW